MYTAQVPPVELVEVLVHVWQLLSWVHKQMFPLAREAVLMQAHGRWVGQTRPAQAFVRAL